MRAIEKYLRRIGEPFLLQETPQADYNLLARIMEGHSRSIPFENFDVVLKKDISIQPADIESKLVDDKRGGYCWEQNNLLQIALEALGYDVTPLLARVRWGKADDSEEPNTTFTHLTLKVKTNDEKYYLADVGFAGTNSMRPISLDLGSTIQKLPEGSFRISPSKHVGFHILELYISTKKEWKPLYEWRDEKAAFVDQECSNWYSYTYPTARFTNQLFCFRIIGETRHHILNDLYVIRKGHGVDMEMTEERIVDKEMLLGLIDGVFGIRLVDCDGIDRFLP
mmetsp:Transcript_8368/g.12294  ORF Transcript_8368/g.12294 Transcript_8368/m.12294 type:complete len:281 (-) Transcript_8368:102-944(-)